MNAAEFHRLAEMFEEAVSVAPPARRDGPDVESLLRFDYSPPLFLSDDGITALAFVRDWLERTECDGEDSIPEELAGYPIMGLLGVGASGGVYRARQFNPTRDVALKVMRSGLVTTSMRRRFEYEAEVLARLHHAGVAQVYASGVTREGAAGQPYLVMELVEGRPLTEHARAANLDTVSRLRMLSTRTSAA